MKERPKTFLWPAESAGAFDPALTMAFYPGKVQGKNSVK